MSFLDTVYTIIVSNFLVLTKQIYSFLASVSDTEVGPNQNHNNWKTQTRPKQSQLMDKPNPRLPVGPRVDKSSYTCNICIQMQSNQ